MHIAVISDTHANPVALEAVLADIARAGAQEIWHLGDVVDWGPDPAACMRLLDQSVAHNIAGNHDRLLAGMLGPLDRMRFGDHALLSSHYSARALGASEVSALGALAPELELGRYGVHLVHGSVRDPVWEYIDGPEVAGWSLDASTHRLVMAGHTHRQAIYGPDEHGAFDYRLRDGWTFTPGEPVHLEGRRAVLNPGSVGQSRDPDDPRACWMSWDSDRDTITMHRVAYDISLVRARIADMGAPDWFAALLGPA